ncbi:MAG: hypothetical protein F6K47_42695 [Symploca sp. SIO2E6]|nr:hypothetical protein [Symploca sp. SIO2E6]
MKSKVLIATFILILLSSCGKAKQEPELSQASPEAKEESNYGESKRSNAVNNKIDSKVAKAAGLSAGQTKKLEVLKNYNPFPNFSTTKDSYYTVILPTHIPQGFKIDKFEVGKELILYKIVYKDNNNYCFAISVSEAQLGGPPAFYKNIENIYVSNIGNIPLGHTEFDKYSITPPIMTQFILFGDHQTNLGSIFYELSSPSWTLGEYDNCEFISLKEAVKIIKSLRFLNPEDSNKNFEFSPFVSVPPPGFK